MDELMAITSKQHSIVDLNNKALAQINGSTIKPTYDRSQLQAGIVHIGVGNFHRAHLSWYNGLAGQSRRIIEALLFFHDLLFSLVSYRIGDR